ncbi:MAG: hypothetical protein IDH49_14930 [Gammaproteobacteria bacterium]|nr:hypothetical protein [Gammaproteobacteria bacterium]
MKSFVNRIKFMLVVLAAIAVMGCASFDYPLPSGVSLLTQPSGSAIVILSTGAKTHSISAAYNLVITNELSHKRVASLPIDNYTLKSHFPDHIGFVHVLYLEQGQYNISFEVLNPSLIAHNRNPLSTFEVKAGEPVYVGEVYYLSGGDYAISNKIDRDMSILSKTNPDISTSNVTVRLIQK